MTRDEKYMKEALALARKGKGRVEPNPPVGAIVVKGSRIIGMGYHARYGGPHAEVSALRKAGPSARGATLIVTLEPCAVQGKTPPCTDAIRKSGINEVVIAAGDPDPANRGKGSALLRKAGLKVREGILRREGRMLIETFTNFMKGNLPLVVMKWAMTLDGRIATEKGDSFWITGEKSRKRVHVERGRSEAIITGIGTVMADDPLLTCRYGVRGKPMRVIVDSKLRIPLASRIVQTAKAVPTCIASLRGIGKDKKIASLEKKGCEVLFFARGSGGVDIRALLKKLRKMGVRRVFVEGGGRLNGTLFSLGMVDKVLVFVGPKIVAGAGAPGPVEGKGKAKMIEVPRVEILGGSRIESDFWMEGIVRNQKGYM